MARAQDPKSLALRASGSLNPHPERVLQALFSDPLKPFFDARDLVQLKYEMLRSVEQDGSTISEAAEQFGFSRVTYYEVKKAFDAEGLPGLVPHKRGPRQGHKLNDERVAFLEDLLTHEPDLHLNSLAQKVNERFGIEVHPRSIRRVLGRRASRRKVPD